MTWSQAIIIYYLIVLIQCQTCHSTCAQCSDIACVSCSPPTAKYISGLQCVNCAAPLICVASAITGCNGAYYLQISTNTCLPCESSCSTCTSTACTSCANQTTQYISGLTCASCIAPLICTFYQISGCSGSYYWNVSNNIHSCVACGENCATCTSTACIACTNPINYQIDSIGSQCSPCVYPEICSSSAITDCSEGFYLETTTNPKECVACIGTCRICTSSVCSGCYNLTNYYFSGVTCVYCTWPLLCESNVITGCLPGINYYFNTSTSPYSCSPCGLNCSRCTSSECTECFSPTGQFIIGTTCTFCTYPLVCSSSTITGCNQPTNFYLSTLTTPYSCISCSPPLICSASTITGCLGAHYLNGLNCIACPNNCITCTQSICTACSGAYYLNSPTCIACPQQCSVCTSTTCSACVIPCLTCSFSGCLTCISDNYYTSDQTCIQCHSTCATCNVYGCLTCPNVNQYISGVECITCPEWCLTCTSIGCQSCVFPCATCTLTGCASCIADDYLLIAGSTSCTQCEQQNAGDPQTCTACDPSGIGCSICPADQFLYFDSNLCDICPNHCATCTATTCLTCKEPCYTCSLYECLSCMTTNMYPSGTLCNSCATSCKVCSPVGCLSCLLNNQYIQDQDCLTCPAQCLTCDAATCMTCISPCSTCNHDACLSCINGVDYFIQGTTCTSCSWPLVCFEDLIVGCSGAYYLDVTSSPYTCVPCQNGCSVCDNTGCSECTDQVNYYVNQDNCEPCPPEFICSLNQITGCTPDLAYYFDSNLGSCIPCGANCTLCNSVSCTSCLDTTSYYINGMECLQCDIPYICESSSLVSCNSNYYFDANALDCISCHFNCLKCSSATVCTECTDPVIYYLDGPNCQECVSPFVCNNSEVIGCDSELAFYFDSSNPQYCVACEDDCLSCTKSECSICTSTTAYFIQGPLCSPCVEPLICSQNQIIGCNSNLPFYFYNTINIKQCVPCEQNCISCTSLGCTECVSPMFYINNNYCEQCNPPLICTDNMITGCLPPYNLDSSSSPHQCEECTDSGYFFDVISKTCITCNMYCGSCTSIMCIYCTDQINYYIDGVNCKECNFPFYCASSHIIGCNPLLPYYQDDSTYPPSCISCGSNCASCTSPVCTQCLDQSKFYIDGYNCMDCTSPQICSNSLLIGCPPQYYLRLEAVKQCISCGIHCLTCNLSSCTSCIDEQQYYLDGQNCKQCTLPLICTLNQIIGCTYNSGVYFDTITNTCIDCQNNCQICTSTVCNLCVNNLKLIGSQCMCEQGYYLEDKVCVQCSRLCQSCQSQNACLQCRSQPNIILKYSQCICQDGYYEQQGNCLICDIACKTCIGQSTNCITCSFDNTIIHNGNCICQNGYFMIAPLICQQCSGQCLECFSRDQCSMCQISYHLSNQQCINCGSGCNDCHMNQSNIICTSCQSQYNLVDFKCIQEIPAPTMSTQNSTILSFMNAQHISQLFIESNKILIEFRFTNIYINNNLAINITYHNKPYVSLIGGIMVDNFNSSEFTFSLGTTRTSSNDIHEITFNFTKSTTQLDLISIQIQFADITTKEMLSLQFLAIAPNAFQISIPNPQVQQAQSSVQYTFILSILMTVIFGGFGLVLAVCDIIAWLSTFYYLNIIYPSNVNYILQNLNLQQFLLLPSYSPTLNQPEDPYHFAAPFKFMQNQVDPLFVNNLFNDCALIALPIIFYIASIIYYIIEKVLACRIKHKHINVYQSCALFTKVHLQLHNNSQYYIKQIRVLILKQIHLNMLDLMFACCLQLMSNPPNAFSIVKFNTLAAGATILFIIILCYFMYLSALKHPVIHQTQSFKDSYACLYESLNVQNLNHRLYGCIILYSKILYIFFLVSLYDYPLLQTGFCAGEYFLLVIYVSYSNPYIDTSTLIKEIVPNLCVLFILLTTVFLAFNERSHLVKDTTMIGWIILTFIAMSVLTQLYFLLKHLIGEIIQRFKVDSGSGIKNQKIFHL